MKKLLFLINPIAGRRVVGKYLFQILDTFSKAGFETVVHISTSGEDIKNVFYEYAKDFDCMVCCGGDGTLNSATDSMIRSGEMPLFGYIPAGTVNDFATTHRIPKKPLRAAELIADQLSRPMDVGLFNDMSFVYVAAFGSIADASYSTSATIKKSIGRLAYLLEGAKNMLHMRTYHLKLTFDNEETIENDFIFGSFSNSCSIGGFKLPILRDYCPDDGKMEIILVKKPKSIDEANRIISVLLTQKADEKTVFYRQAHEVTVEDSEELPWTVDGEFGGAPLRAEISMRRQVINMIC